MQDPASKIVLVTVFTTLLILMLCGFIISILIFYQKRKSDYFKNLDKVRTEYEKDLLTAQLEIQENTFLSISQEIHDNIGLSLTLAKLNLNSAKIGDSKTHENLLFSSQELISKAILDLSDLSKSFNADVILNQGLCFSFESELQRIKRNFGIEVHFDVSGDEYFLDSKIEILLFRIFQECLNNILKHAMAKRIEVFLKYSQTNFTLRVTDDGRGFQESEVIKFKKSSSGLKNIKKRASLMNAEAKITSFKGEGTTVSIELPVK